MKFLVKKKEENAIFFITLVQAVDHKMFMQIRDGQTENSLLFEIEGPS